jgi:hypothetical protein
MSFVKLEALKGPHCMTEVLTGYGGLLDASFSACVRMDNLQFCRVSTRGVICMCETCTCVGVCHLFEVRGS